jgi:hypothetical protein
MPEEMARPLPFKDIHAIFDVILTLYSELFNGEGLRKWSRAWRAA